MLLFVYLFGILSPLAQKLLRRHVVTWRTKLLLLLCLMLACNEMGNVVTNLRVHEVG